MQDPDEQLDAQTERVDDLSSMIDHREAALAAFEVRNLENEAAAFAGPESMEEAFCPPGADALRKRAAQMFTNGAGEPTFTREPALAGHITMLLVKLAKEAVHELFEMHARGAWAERHASVPTAGTRRYTVPYLAVRWP